MKGLVKIAIIAVVMGAAGYGIYILSIPESEKIRHEISRVLDGPGSDFSKVFKIERLQDELASAYLQEKKYDEAIEIYEKKIEKLRRESEERKHLFSERRHSTSYALEAALFRLLALAYEQKQDKISSEKANKKAAELDAISARVKKTEPVKNKKSVLD